MTRSLAVDNQASMGPTGGTCNRLRTHREFAQASRAVADDMLGRGLG